MKRENIFAEIVLCKRFRLGMSAKELAAKCGWSEKTFYRKMANPENLKLKEVWTLEKMLGLKRGDLAGL